jgi:hypothetical protein
VSSNVFQIPIKMNAVATVTPPAQQQQTTETPQDTSPASESPTTDTD